jgi:hypothetical protein
MPSEEIDTVVSLSVPPFVFLKMNFRKQLWIAQSLCCFHFSLKAKNITRPQGEYHFFAAKNAAEKYHISSPTKYITAMPETVKLPALPLTHPRLLFRRSGSTEYTVSMRLCAIGALRYMRESNPLCPPMTPI